LFQTFWVALYYNPHLPPSHTIRLLGSLHILLD
jgi:hypothetical protein